MSCFKSLIQSAALAVEKGAHILADKADRLERGTQALALAAERAELQAQIYKLECEQNATGVSHHRELINLHLKVREVTLKMKAFREQFQENQDEHR